VKLFAIVLASTSLAAAAVVPVASAVGGPARIYGCEGLGVALSQTPNAIYGWNTVSCG
jgi:hypothetical protein